MVCKLIVAGTILAVLTGAAAAQLPMPGLSLGAEKRKLSPEEQAKQDAIDHEYKSAIQKIPDKKPTDPWGNIRDTSQTPPKNKQQ